LGNERHIIDKLLEEDYTSIDIAVALLKMVVGEQEKEDKLQEEIDTKETGAEPGMVRFFINIGKNQKIRPGDIVGAIAGETGMPGNLIGTIDIYEKFTFVEIPKKYAKNVLKGMNKSKIRGKAINIEKANKK